MKSWRAQTRMMIRSEAEWMSSVVRMSQTIAAVAKVMVVRCVMS